MRLPTPTAEAAAAFLRTEYPQSADSLPSARRVLATTRRLPRGFRGPPPHPQTAGHKAHPTAREIRVPRCATRRRIARFTMAAREVSKLAAASESDVFHREVQCGEYTPVGGTSDSGPITAKAARVPSESGIDVHPRVAEQATKRIEVGGILKVFVVSKITFRRSSRRAAAPFRTASANAAGRAERDRRSLGNPDLGFERPVPDSRKPQRCAPAATNAGNTAND